MLSIKLELYRHVQADNDYLTTKETPQNITWIAQLGTSGHHNDHIADNFAEHHSESFLKLQVNIWLLGVL